MIRLYLKVETHVCMGCDANLLQTLGMTATNTAEGHQGVAHVASVTPPAALQRHSASAIQPPQPPQQAAPTQAVRQLQQQQGAVTSQAAAPADTAAAGARRDPFNFSQSRLTPSSEEWTQSLQDSTEIRNKLSAIFQRIAGGSDRQQVRQRW